MTLPVPGTQISMSQVNVELNVASTTQISLNDTAVRSLGGKTTAGSTIAMSDLSGKSGRVPINSAATTYSTHQTNLVINVSQIAGYIAGKSDITLTIGSGVYIYSTSTSVPGLTITGATTGDTVTLVNNGYIIGMGGNATGDYVSSADGLAGGPAMSLGCAITIQNNGYIAGGGGSGGCFGGGGAGGGNGSTSSNITGAQGAAGGGIGQAGGSITTNGSFIAGGGGGRILPGQGGLQSAGGGAGGGGGYWIYRTAGFLTVWVHMIGGGGGGWGAAGGSGTTGSYPTNTPGTPGLGGSGGAAGTNGVVVSVTTTRAGGAGGAAINRNGYTVTWSASGTVYGSY